MAVNDMGLTKLYILIAIDDRVIGINWKEYENIKNGIGTK